MILRPRLEDYRNIAYYSGKIIYGVGLLMILPLAIAVIFYEWNQALNFLIGIFSCFSLGLSLQVFFPSKEDLSWLQGMVVVSFSWLLAMLLGAIPHYLSGHFGSFLDACFDLMSGYTTTGLFLLQDLDHVSHAMNMWRHLLTYAGGQGIIVVALTFLVSGSGSAFKIYVGEGKEEKLLPNIIQTARAIWLISLSYLFLGSLILWVITIFDGMTPTRGLLHAIWIFMAAWSTGGFAPQSFNVSYYHNFAFEVITVILFMAGSFNFALHWAVWTGKRREIHKNIEIISFATTITMATLITLAGLAALNTYPEITAMFRKGFYHVASGHTGTGFMTVHSRTFVRQWGEMGMLGVITLAMAIGGRPARPVAASRALGSASSLRPCFKMSKRSYLPSQPSSFRRYITSKISS
ncbi:MAG: potassium transporter TrkG [Actinomycetota bacterium]|nr:potassium transporter TrkG [Actinomycetota bacterium]